MNMCPRHWAGQCSIDGTYRTMSFLPSWDSQSNDRDESVISDDLSQDATSGMRGLCELGTGNAVQCLEASNGIR